MLETPSTDGTTQPEFEEEGEEGAMEWMSLRTRRKNFLKMIFASYRRLTQWHHLHPYRLNQHPFSISSSFLCRLVVVPMVRPILSCDVKKLEQEFCHGYLASHAAFYVSTTNEDGERIEFTNKELST